MSKHSKTHAHEHLRRRLRREGALERREADIQKYSIGSELVMVNGLEHKRAKKLAVAKREVEALRKKLGL